MTEFLLGLDVGLTMVKAVLFDRDGRAVAESSRRCGASTPAPHWVERDMEELWLTCVETVRECVASARVPRGSIAAVGIAGHGDGLYLVDEEFRPVRPAVLSLDSRARDLIADWRAAGTFALALELTGQEPWVASPLAIWAWLARHEPESLARSRWLLFCKDWVRLRLTGALATDPSDASPLTDVDGAAWSSEILNLPELEGVSAKLPPIRASSSAAGTVSAAAARASGLAQGTPVVCGSHDVDACAIGMGAVASDSLALIAGTFSISQVLAPAPRLDSRWQTRTFVEPGRWLHMAATPASTAGLDWLVSEIYGLDGSYDVVERAVRAASSAAGSVYFLPFLYGDAREPEASGAFIGLRGWHERGELFRAVLEGAVCSQRLQVEALTSVFELEARARLAGGATHSPFWSQLFADGLCLEIEVADTDEAGARGAAVLAGLGIGVWPDLESAVKETVRVARTYTPDPVRAAAFDRTYDTFRELRDALAPLWMRL